MTAAIGFILLGWWFSYDPTTDFIVHTPKMDGSPSAEERAAVMETVAIGAFFGEYEGIPSELPGEWPMFRGARSDNIVHDAPPLADVWPDSGPERIWSVDLGEGHAAPAVKNGRVYLLDYDEEADADALRCFSLTDGREIWRRWYTVRLKRNHGFSRTVPAVTERYVVSFGPRSHVMCVDAESGDFVWGLDLERDYGVETPFWYTGQCPYIHGDEVILAPAGTALVLGVNIATGEVLWETPNPKGWKMSHVSVMPMTLGGKRMAVYSAIGGTVGVSLEDGERGTVLWETSLWNKNVLAPSPVIMEGGRIFFTAGYGAGSMVLQVTETNGSFTVERLQEYKPIDGLASEQQTPLYWDGHLFGIQPKDAGALRQQFVCYHPDDCTRVIWSSGETRRFGLGPYFLADGKIYILNDDGVLTMIEASTSGYRQLAQAQIIDGHDAWGPLALAGDRLLLRDATRMVCIDIGVK